MSRGSINTFPGISSSSYADKLAITPPASKFASRFTQLSWTEKLSRFVYGTLGFHSAFHLLDNGLANLFALDILKHGTNIKSYLSICLRGADPKMGGTNQGVYAPGSPNCTNQFYVMPNSTKLGIAKIHSILVPPLYTHAASANLLGHKAGDGGSLKATLLGFCTPTLRFKFRPEDVTPPRFEETDRIEGALFTTHSISPWRLGIYGSLRQGIGPGMFRRMASHPIKVLSGVAMIGGAAYIGKRTYTYVTSKPQLETSVSQAQETAVLRPRGLMNPMTFAAICGIAQSILKIGLSYKAARNPFAVFTSAAVVGAAAYIGKRRYNLVKSGEAPNARRDEEIHRKTMRVVNPILTMYGLLFRALGAYLLGVV